MTQYFHGPDYNHDFPCHRFCCNPSWRVQISLNFKAWMIMLLRKFPLAWYIGVVWDAKCSVLSPRRRFSAPRMRNEVDEEADYPTSLLQLSLRIIRIKILWWSSRYHIDQDITASCSRSLTYCRKLSRLEWMQLTGDSLKSRTKDLTTGNRTFWGIEGIENMYHDDHSGHEYPASEAQSTYGVDFRQPTHHSFYIFKSQILDN